ncbi:MAG: aspartate/glutamate racemase family protein [Hyphomicrobiaceae bacterium]
MTRAKPLRIGLVVPSSNTMVEQELPKLLPRNGSATLHFARLGVTHISGSVKSNAQFEMDRMVETAVSLADAQPDVIVWAGTAASWLGFARDEVLARRITKATGVPATTSLLALNEALETLKVRRIGLVTPYIAKLENDIIANYAAAGIEVASAERLDLTVNTDYAKVPPSRVARMCRAVAKAKPDAIVIMCTNLAGAPVAGETGKSLGIPILDSVATTLTRAFAVARQGRLRAHRPRTATDSSC